MGPQPIEEGEGALEGAVGNGAGQVLVRQPLAPTALALTESNCGVTGWSIASNICFPAIEKIREGVTVGGTAGGGCLSLQF